MARSSPERQIAVCTAGIRLVGTEDGRPAAIVRGKPIPVSAAVPFRAALGQRDRWWSVMAENAIGSSGFAAHSCR